MNPEPIFEIHEANYDWCWFAVYAHPVHPGKYATFNDQGCSCTAPERPQDEQLRSAEPLDRASVRTEMTAFVSRHSWIITAGDAVRYLEELQRALSTTEVGA
jgi:hypothetical protein